MAELRLTAERRDELVALISDDERLRAEYPKVADYLNMTLPATENPQGDAAFDWRLIHYMTGNEPTSVNPYWNIVETSVFESHGRRVVNGGNTDGSARLAYVQFILQAAYAYAIPSPETLAWVQGFCDGRSVIEVGAGRGYWAAQLTRQGLKVDAYDIEPPDSTNNPSFERAPGQKDVWHHVGTLGEAVSRFDESSDSVLFLCWPPGWGNAMASQTLDQFERSGGTRLIFIGEPKGGKTGDDAFFDALTARWELESHDGQHVSWWNLNDITQGWRRR